MRKGRALATGTDLQTHDLQTLLGRSPIPTVKHEYKTKTKREHVQ